MLARLLACTHACIHTRGLLGAQIMLLDLKFFEDLASILDKTNATHWVPYMRWRFIDALSQHLGDVIPRAPPPLG